MKRVTPNLLYRSILTWNLRLLNCECAQLYREILYFFLHAQLLPSQLSRVFEILYEFVHELVLELLLHKRLGAHSQTDTYIY